MFFFFEKKFFIPGPLWGPLRSKKFQKTLILAFEANSALSRENETKIVKITHSASQRKSWNKKVQQRKWKPFFFFFNSIFWSIYYLSGELWKVGSFRQIYSSFSVFFYVPTHILKIYLSWMRFITYVPIYFVLVAFQNITYFL